MWDICSKAIQLYILNVGINVFRRGHISMAVITSFSNLYRYAIPSELGWPVKVHWVPEK